MSFINEDLEAVAPSAAELPACDGAPTLRRPEPVKESTFVDEALFTALIERHRPGLQAHCYRMLGSFEDAEDQVQETALRAWRKRDVFEGRSTMSAWLYKIATNACLDLLRRRAARVVPPEEQSAAERSPEVDTIDRETIELVLLVAIQGLRPDQRSVLIFRDLLGWSAKEAAETLGVSDAAVHSSLLRARATIREHLAPDRVEWRRLRRPSRGEREVLERCLAAHGEGDSAHLADLLKVTTNPRVLPRQM